ncbi:MAG: hypothetical protein NC834_01990 [Candidatus Omnitrophica bacterium]|nr:hypothetical protein [Candidatus Omnitrophota bacterium]
MEKTPFIFLKKGVAMGRLEIFRFWFVILIFAFWILNFEFAYATPSTTYWTPCTSDIQAYKRWHITYDSYFTVDKKGTEKGDFPTDVGLTVGVLPFEKLNLEVGFDILQPTDDPLYFNAKLGFPENSLFEGSPALNIGIFNVGTKKGVTNYNILDFIAGKTLPFNFGRIHLGYYVGLGEDDSGIKTLRSSSGKEDNDGFMIGYDKYIYKDKIMFAADWAFGKNAIGGGGFGLYYFFTPDIDLLTGPVWFEDQGLNGNWKWTLQLDINF